MTAALRRRGPRSKLDRGPPLARKGAAGVVGQDLRFSPARECGACKLDLLGMEAPLVARHDDRVEHQGRSQAREPEAERGRKCDGPRGEKRADQVGDEGALSISRRAITTAATVSASWESVMPSAAPSRERTGIRARLSATLSANPAPVT